MNIIQAVMVLAPNGRRQTVKVTPNTTILQVLEEVCKKQGFKAEEYNIKHHNKCLDTSTIFRFSGLPNNAQLELVEAASIRQEGIVTLVVQLENNTRLTESFPPSTTLWEILMKLCPDETASENLVLIYMRQEICGQFKLKQTTLRSLGLTNGRALFRLIHRREEELHTQANVSVPLPSKPTEEKPFNRSYKKDFTNQFEFQAKLVNEENKLDDHTLERKSVTKETDVIKIIKQERKKEKICVKFETFDSQKESISIDSQNITRVPNDKDNTDLLSKRTLTEEEFVFLGKRNAMIFSQETAQAIPNTELPDEFFDLTVDDAKKLLRDLKKHRLELENAPLQTSALRNLELSKQQLRLLNRYKSSVIRVYFPDHTVLQGTFGSTDDIHTVKEFVQEYLENNRMDFYLYTTPPKTVLNENDRLIEIGCVPNAILYFGYEGIPRIEKYLKNELIDKFTTPSIASLAAAKIRRENTRMALASMDCDECDFEDQDDINAGASTSTAGNTSYEDYPSRYAKSNENDSTPKWFKLSK